eukprot:gnl/TRDRNA2_/TRDRNA2_120119_c1_seq1.p1 gnl/TRDRNA2_/TRDRNA2_120119_c1~~gnl/TRDRNA2_/TRDRNA2_120119_c1_seq1.p1  ORF type:complete len:160 (+),score=12.25 gnl/TRDRNA2_/TRDRNA2_120119_c1_seq1:25-504(+)
MCQYLWSTAWGWGLYIPVFFAMLISATADGVSAPQSPHCDSSVSCAGYRSSGMDTALMQIKKHNITNALAGNEATMPTTAGYIYQLKLVQGGAGKGKCITCGEPDKNNYVGKFCYYKPCKKDSPYQSFTKTSDGKLKTTMSELNKQFTGPYLGEVKYMC